MTCRSGNLRLDHLSRALGLQWCERLLFLPAWLQKMLHLASLLPWLSAVQVENSRGPGLPFKASSRQANHMPSPQGLSQNSPVGSLERSSSRPSRSSRDWLGSRELVGKGPHQNFPVRARTSRARANRPAVIAPQVWTLCCPSSDNHWLILPSLPTLPAGADQLMQWTLGTCQDCQALV